jgi:dihydrofolate reductase
LAPGPPSAILRKNPGAPPISRIVYDVAVRLDGYIAGENDDISAFPGEGDHVSAYLARLETYQNFIMGRRTYEFGYRFGLVLGARA